MNRDGSGVGQLWEEFVNPPWLPDGMKIRCGRRLGTPVRLGSKHQASPQRGAEFEWRK
jgi:hypothetical protein